MYKVYSDDILIHDSISPSEEIHLIDPTLTIEDSSAGSFEFTITPKNYGYNSITKFTSTIIIYKNNSIIWTGRAISGTEDFWHRVRYTCEGALAFLNDSQQPFNKYNNINSDNFLSTLISNHNSRVTSNRRVQIGTITKHDAYDTYKYKTDYKSTLDTIREQFLDRIGGHFRVRYSGSSTTPILDYYSDYPNTSTQEINFGENLLDFTKNWDFSEICTVIIPRGKQLDRNTTSSNTSNNDNYDDDDDDDDDDYDVVIEEENSGSRGLLRTRSVAEDIGLEEDDVEYLTIESVNNGSIYLQNTEAVNTYGIVEKTVDFNNAETASVLKSMGEMYLSSIQFDDVVLEISAVDLHMFNPNIRSFELLDKVKCISAPHGLNKYFPITKIVIPLDKPDGVTYTLGTNTSCSMSSSVISAGNKFENQIAKGMSATLLNAKKNAASIINSVTTGYVNIITENDISQALIISETPDVENSERLWRFNMNGLGYTKDGGETYDVAITMDGSIVADFIHTGTIDDGFGYNRWNLTTGEFQMAYNTEIANLIGNTVTVTDIVTLAQEGVELGTEALLVESGSSNILRGSNVLKSLSGNATWERRSWGKKGTATVTAVDISDAPNSRIKRGVRIQSNSESKYGCITQEGVKVSGKQVYVLSCYVKGSGKMALRITDGYGVVNSMRKTVAISNQTEWKRCYRVFKTGPNNVFNPTDSSLSQSNIKNLVAIKDNKLSVDFGTSEGTSDLYICGMQLERGNKPSDWHESDDDAETLANEFTKAQSASDLAYTDSQRDALDASFNQYKVLQRLTNNFAAKGIYLSNNQLYINGTYIRTGTLDAGIIKTGILTDTSGKVGWNLTTGQFNATNANLTGSIAAYDTLHKSVLSDGSLYFYYRSSSNKKFKTVGSVETYTSNGIRIVGNDSISLNAKYINGKRNDRIKKYTIPNILYKIGNTTYYANLVLETMGGFVEDFYLG